MKIKYVILGLGVIGAASFAIWKNQQLQADELVGISGINGRLELKRLDVATLYAGRVEAILVQEGEKVKAGQDLARLSSDISRTQVDAAVAQKTQAEDRVKRALAEIEARQQQMKVAKLELDNAVKLRRDNLVSTSELERRQASYHAAVAAVNTVQAAKAEAEAAVLLAQAQLAKAESQNADMIIKAPKDGRVEYQVADVGNVLGPGGKVVSLLDPSDSYINVFLAANQMNQLNIGDDARIVVDGIDAVFPANISFIANNAQFTPKSVETTEERAKLMFKVKLQIPVEIALKYNGLLKGGMTALGYVKYDPQVQWPEWLTVKLP